MDIVLSLSLVVIVVPACTIVLCCHLSFCLVWFCRFYKFSYNITLATVLTTLFSLTDNSYLLNLHFHQQHPAEIGENKIQTSVWITALVNALSDKLGKNNFITIL
jgi:hypothetical protein